MAVNCCTDPAATEELEGVTAMDTRVAVVAVNRVDPLIVPEVALIVVLPAATTVANPVALMVATLVTEEVHETELVRLAVVPLE